MSQMDEHAWSQFLTAVRREIPSWERFASEALRALRSYRAPSPPETPARDAGRCGCDGQKGQGCTICASSASAPRETPDRVIVGRALARLIIELDDVNGWLPTSLQAQGEAYETAREVLRDLDMEPERPEPRPPEAPASSPTDPEVKP